MSSTAMSGVVPRAGRRVVLVWVVLVWDDTRGDVAGRFPRGGAGCSRDETSRA